MQLIRCATLSVANLDVAIARYAEWLGYRLVERGQLSMALAMSWKAPGAAGSDYAVLQPASGRLVYLRLVSTPAYPDYQPLRSYGWNAIEICVQDVVKVADRMVGSPFEIIGPPTEIAGLPAIFPMQVRGPDGEIVYLTEIRDNLPDFELPRASSLIDSLFILVMGCSDLSVSREWIAQYLQLGIGRRETAITYTMLANAYDTPEDELHVIATMTHERDVFLELDQYPDAAVSRQRHADHLWPGVSVGSFIHPQFDEVAKRCRDLWISPPAVHDSCIYDGRHAATVAAPDGTLFEIIDGR